MSLFGDIGKFVGVEGPGSHAQSQQTLTTSTTNIDKRLVVDQGIGISSDNSTFTFNSLDENAVNNAVALSAHAIDLSKSSSDTAYKSLGEIVGLSKDLVQLEGQTAVHISDAYQNAADSAAGVRQIGIIGIIVVGIVLALMAYKVSR